MKRYWRGAKDISAEMLHFLRSMLHEPTYIKNTDDDENN